MKPDALPECGHPAACATTPDNPPHEGEAMKYRKTALTEAVRWFKPGDHPAVGPLPDGHPIARHALLPAEYGWVATLEGGHVVTPGDWIAGPGARGEFWPIKPDVFAATYEAVTEPDPPARYRYESGGEGPLDPRDLALIGARVELAVGIDALSAAQARAALATALLHEFMRAPNVLPDDHPCAWTRALAARAHVEAPRLFPTDTAALEAALRKAGAEAYQRAAEVADREEANHGEESCRVIASRLRRMADDAKAGT